ncbi:OLC1v1033155C2 [Oldenlandia corymbosa var. corymbosa]|nr:OLC1v1033155C2 [Oldenlandia corymbosa var. corymbosa]
MNPRDCWYWLNGNCLNPKCSFRHPPLDGLLGTQMPNPVGAPGPASQPAIAPTAPASGSFPAGKQGVACIFFQKGTCFKGDWCPFSHGTNPASNKVPQTQAAVPATEPSIFKKTFGLEKCTEEKKAPHINNLKPVELTNQTNMINKVEPASAKQDLSSKKTFQHSSGIVDEPHRNRPTDTRLPIDGSRVNMPNRVQQPLQVNHRATTLNGKDAEEVSREPSPGFDVLVDNEPGDSDYYHNNEDQFVRARDRDGMIEYFDGHSADYSARVDADHALYRDSRAYDSHERPHGRYASEQHRSSKPMSGGLGHQERRRYGRGDSPDQGDHSDLRHRLSKHRRGNGLRSVINHDSARERPDERRHQVSQRDLGRDRERQEHSLSSRLRGRIKIPATDGTDQRLSRDVERGREYSGRLSPGRSQVSSRLRDRIKGLVQDGTNNDGRIDRGPLVRRDFLGDNYGNFSAPRSLSELKSQRSADGFDQQVTGKRKFMKSDYQQQTGEDLSFEGPKPLEEILKRKRGAGTAEFEGNQTSNSIGSNIQERNEEAHDLDSRNIGSDVALHKNEDYKSEDGKIASEALPDGKSLSHNINEAEVEDGMIVEDGGEDQDPEAYDQGEEEYEEYEQGDEDNYNLDETENLDGEEEEYLDEDDDEFAKKMGVLY